MKIIIATPLYPPEISYSASYVKELAKRLSKQYEVVVVTYGHVPEKVSGIKIYTANKNRPLFFRLISYTFILWKISGNSEIIYAQNGASAELPVIIVSMIRNLPFVFSISDTGSQERASKGGTLGFIEGIAIKKAVSLVKDFPSKKPIISPFESINKKDFDEYELSWEEHINHLEKILKNGRKI